MCYSHLKNACAGLIILTAFIFVFPVLVFAAEIKQLSSAIAGQTLEDFFTAAVEFSPQLRIAEEQLNIGRARDDQASGQLRPQINANANLSENSRNSFDAIGSQIEEDFDGQRYSISVQQVLFNWQAFASKRRTEKIKDQLEAEYFFELSNLLTEVAGR